MRFTYPEPNTVAGCFLRLNRYGPYGSTGAYVTKLLDSQQIRVHGELLNNIVKVEEPVWSVIAFAVGTVGLPECRLMKKKD